MSDEDGLMVLCEPCARDRHTGCWGRMLTRRDECVMCSCSCPRATALRARERVPASERPGWRRIPGPPGEETP